MSTAIKSTAERLKAREDRFGAALEQGQQAFMVMGEELRGIREERDYVDQYGDFDTYCNERWDISRVHAHRLITGTKIMDALLPMGNTEGVPMPANERQVRPLSAVPEEERADTWREAVETAPKAEDGTPKVTAKHVKETVEKRNPATKPARNGKPEPEPDPEYGEDDTSADPLAEWEKAEKECERLRGVIASLEKTDAAREITALHAKYAQLNGRLIQETATLNAARSQALSHQRRLNRIAKLLGVKEWDQIEDAIAALQQ